MVAVAVAVERFLGGWKGTMLGLWSKQQPGVHVQDASLTLGHNACTASVSAAAVSLPGMGLVLQATSCLRHGCDLAWRQCLVAGSQGLCRTDTAGSEGGSTEVGSGPSVVGAGDRKMELKLERMDLMLCLCLCLCLCLVGG